MLENNKVEKLTNFIAIKHLINIIWLQQVTKFVNMFIYLQLMQRFNRTFIFEREYHFSLRNDDIRAVTVNEVMRSAKHTILYSAAFFHTVHSEVFKAMKF